MTCQKFQTPDLVLINPQNEKQKVGIEIKIGARFMENQLARLKDGFPFAAYLIAPESYLHKEREITKHSQVSTASFESIHAISAKLAENESEPTKSFLEQFAAFFANHGYARAPITTHPMKATSIQEFAKVMQEWNRVLIKIRGEFGMKRKRQRLEHNLPLWTEPCQSFPNSNWFGVDADDCYVGFEIKDDGTVNCYYETWRQSDQCSKKAREFLGEGEDGRVNSKHRKTLSGVL